jgi:HD-GYP domain-containing protein (c-di-GMP phosphodiesterase class II)
MILDPGERRHLKIPLHVLAASGTTVLLLIVATVLALNAYRGTREVVSSAVDESIQHVSMALKDKIRAILLPAQTQLELLAFHPITAASTLPERMAALPMAQKVLSTNPLLDAWYVGYPDGDFILFRPLRDGTVRDRTHAPPRAAIMVQAISRKSDDSAAGEYFFYDSKGVLLQHDPRADYVFDPRSRPWYANAIAGEGPSVTAPYLFFTHQVVGATLSQRASNGRAVVGLDATLQDLASELRDLKITPGSQVAIVDEAGRVVALEDLSRAIDSDASGKPSMRTIHQLGLPALSAAAGVAASGVVRTSRRIADQAWELISVPLIESAEGRSLRVLMAVPQDELFKDARALLHRQLFITLGLILLSVPGGFWLTQQLVRPLKALADDAHALATFEFGPARLQRSRVAEVDLLASATAQMRATISRFLNVSAALNSETRLERLLEVVLNDVAITVHARSGALYLYDEDRRSLRRSQLRAGSKEADQYPETLPCDTDLQHPAVRVAREHGSVVGAAREGGPELMAVALETFEQEFVGALVLELPRPLQPARQGRRDPMRAFIEALSSTAAVAIATRHLVDSQKQLLEGLIQLLAGAIDAKSPYTGGHCQRVPVITRMLAQAVHDTEAGPFKDFVLNDELREAIHIGAWLHDCGKVTTPEYVVDKATKLEMIYNRIHEVRMRFEVLKRDAEIVFHRSLAEGVPRSVAQADLESLWRTLDDEFAFVASCNVGGESLDDEKIERLRQIAQRSWQRTLDDRIGLSRDEQRQLAGIAPSPLPTREKLLDDKPEHIVERPAGEHLAAENPWGFRMRTPEHKFNHGEIHNLAVSRGTLTDEERYIVNEHIMQSIIMLDRLPFPRHLRNVPEIAGGHHERMDGRGYPRRLTREEMSVPARIMAIADVFEALTAADRPYKAPKTLSESLRIMARMAREQHLDGDIFEIFLKSGVYRAYAESFLQPEQIDEVDVSDLLAQSRVPVPA